MKLIKWLFQKLEQHHEQVILFLYFFFLYIMVVVPQVAASWMYFPDAFDYLHQAQKDLFSMDFLSPSPAVIKFPRPFTTSLLYKLVGGDLYQAVMFQKLLYWLCCCLFCRTLLRFIRNHSLKIFSAAVLLFYFSWWNIAGWTNQLLSESPSQSLLLVWLSALLFFLQQRSLRALILLMLCSIFFSFTRDTWPYILLLAFGLLLLFWWNNKEQFKRYLYFLFAFGLILFFVQARTAAIGERHKLPLLNLLAIRIVPNADYTAWFKKEGAPQMDLLVQNYRHNDLQTDAGTMHMYDLYSDTIYKPLRQWVVEKGKANYIKFMLLHPSYFFLADQSTAQKERIYAYNLRYLYRETGFFTNATNVFPLFNNWVLLGLMIGLLLVYFRKDKDPLLLLPIYLVLLTIANAYLSYNADAMEVERHLFITQILLQLSGILAILLLLNTFIKPVASSETQVFWKLVKH